MAIENYRLNLNTAGWTPAVFSGIEYKPVANDYSLLNRSMALQEERQNKAIQQRSSLDVTLGKIKASLPNNTETNEFINNLETKINKKINNAVDNMDYSSAMNIAIEEAGNLAKDRELIDRIRDYERYNELIEEITKLQKERHISAKSAKYLKEFNKYEYNANNPWDYTVVPVDDFDYTTILKEAFNEIQPDRNNPKTPNVAMRVTRSEIIKQAMSIIEHDNDFIAKATQMFMGDIMYYREHENDLKDPNLSKILKDDNDDYCETPDIDRLHTYIEYKLTNSHQATGLSYTHYNTKSDAYTYYNTKSDDGTGDGGFEPGPSVREKQGADEIVVGM